MLHHWNRDAFAAACGETSTVPNKGENSNFSTTTANTTNSTGTTNAATTNNMTAVGKTFLQGNGEFDFDQQGWQEEAKQQTQTYPQWLPILPTLLVTGTTNAATTANTADDGYNVRARVRIPN